MALFFLAIVVGAVCGAALAFELRTEATRTRTWPQWVAFAGAVLVVSVCAVIAEDLNKSGALSTGLNGLAVLLVGAGFALAYVLEGRRF